MTDGCRRRTIVCWRGAFLLGSTPGRIEGNRTDSSDRIFWNDAFSEEPDQVMVSDRILDQELEGLPVRTALDLGCRSGRSALKLADQGWSVVGVDWAERAIELASGTLLVAEWDRCMAEIWNFVEGDLLSPEGIVDLLPGLDIEKAVARRVAHAFCSDDPHAQEATSANVALVRAWRP